jgi:hypothetical protein
MPTITDDVLKRLSEISTPHMNAINLAVEEAFLNIHPDVTYTAALGFQLGVLLQVLNDEARPQAVALINSLIEQIGFRLAELEPGGHA